MSRPASIVAKQSANLGANHAQTAKEGKRRVVGSFFCDPAGDYSLRAHAASGWANLACLLAPGLQDEESCVTEHPHEDFIKYDT